MEQRRCEECDCCKTNFTPARRAKYENSKKRAQALSEQTNTFRELADELHKPSTRRFTRRRVTARHVDQSGPQTWLRCKNSQSGTSSCSVIVTSGQRSSVSVDLTRVVPRWRTHVCYVWEFEPRLYG